MGGRGALRTQMRLWASGTVAQRAMTATDKGPLVICRNRVRVERARDLVLHCRLLTSVRERLRQERLEVIVATHFHPAGGRTENITRRITLPRG